MGIVSTFILIKVPNGFFVVLNAVQSILLPKVSLRVKLNLIVESYRGQITTMKYTRVRYFIFKIQHTQINRKKRKHG